MRWKVNTQWISNSNHQGIWAVILAYRKKGQHLWYISQPRRVHKTRFARTHIKTDRWNVYHSDNLQDEWFGHDDDKHFGAWRHNGVRSIIYALWFIFFTRCHQTTRQVHEKRQTMQGKSIATKITGSSLFPLSKETLQSFPSTGWFQDQIQAWFK